MPCQLRLGLLPKPRRPPHLLRRIIARPTAAHHRPQLPAANSLAMKQMTNASANSIEAMTGYIVIVVVFEADCLLRQPQNAQPQRDTAPLVRQMATDFNSFGKQAGIPTMTTTATASGNSTNLRIAMPSGSGLPQLKRLAQAVGHFEPTLKALLPLDHAYKSAQEVVALMNPEGAQYFGFNFSMPNSITVSFCPGATCRTMGKFLAYAAVATVFLRASMKLKSTADLKTFPRTLDGLNKFFKSVGRPGVDGMHLNSLLADYKSSKTLKRIPGKVTSGVGELQSKGGA
ncbi:hypothetical protein VTI74DRAFT_11527 [Chaetomium olivicolor]